jgi:hypothetical protein
LEEVEAANEVENGTDIPAHEEIHYAVEEIYYPSEIGSKAR